jgi:hypothetical protein
MTQVNMRAWDVPTLLLRVIFFGGIVAVSVLLLDGSALAVCWAVGFVVMSETVFHGVRMAVQPHRISAIILCMIGGMSVCVAAFVAAALAGVLPVSVLATIAPALFAYAALLIVMPLVI